MNPVRERFLIFGTQNYVKKITIATLIDKKKTILYNTGYETEETY